VFERYNIVSDGDLDRAAVMPKLYNSYTTGEFAIRASQPMRFL
jgi:hypothetical protein